MAVKKVFKSFAFVVLVVLTGFTISYIFYPKQTIGFALQVSSHTKMISFRSKVEPTSFAWKTYTDEKHGFSFQYPEGWAKSSGIYSKLATQSGISASAIDVPDCSTADDYFQKEVLPYYPNINKAPISNPNLDGFIIEEHHLDFSYSPGPEAYIINCPYVIRLGFNPTGSNQSDKVFERIINSFKIWQPPK